jgi:hypothetical protein
MSNGFLHSGRRDAPSKSKFEQIESRILVEVGASRATWLNHVPCGARALCFFGMKRLLLLVGLTACAHIHVRSASHYFDEAQAPSGELVLREGMPLVEVRGSPEEIGRASGVLFKEALATVRDETLVEYHDQFESIRARMKGLEGQIPERYHAELAATASASGESLADLELANLVVDSCCTAFVASGAATSTGRLLFARNMDFMPAHVLGPSTVVELVRPEGKKAFVSLGWPGVNGVISGMNEDGLCAAILVQFAVATDKTGVPLGYVVRSMLEECSTIEEARAFFARTRVASGHYVFVADATTGFVFGEGVARSPQPDNLLTCSNDNEVSFAKGIQAEPRARALDDLLHGHRGELDPALARRILGATYVEHMNAQAMVFEPATRTLWLSRGTTLRAAARQSAVRIELAHAFRGGIRDARVEECSSESAFPHYKGAEYRGVTIAPRMARAASELAAALEGRSDVEKARIGARAAYELGTSPEEMAAKHRLLTMAIEAVEALARAGDERGRNCAFGLLLYDDAGHDLTAEERRRVEAAERAPITER